MTSRKQSLYIGVTVEPARSFHNETLIETHVQKVLIR